MSKLEESANFSSYAIPEQTNGFTRTTQAPHSAPHKEGTLRTEVDKSLKRFFQQLENEPVTDLHRMVMSEVEAPLLEAVMRYTGNNQSKASVMLGLNRGTLRTKLKHYGML
ncbi:MAG TPA: DNA-binding transcriptional regulator Fis [Gammaproteobacteria bacterium]|nr:DNA-binding transcriptional regulator Fis [Gammaproteobacteria bacterium]HCL71233.1 DNA-binding transcriptional regulator Fis [Gammaproteobacteria bacterium]